MRDKYHFVLDSTTRTPLFRLIDLLLEGGLEHRLQTYVDAGVSARAARNLLMNELAGEDLEISAETVRRWFSELRDDQVA